MAVMLYTPVWVVMIDGWDVVGPFNTEEEAQAFAEKWNGDAVDMMTPSDFEEHIMKEDEEDEGVA